MMQAITLPRISLIVFIIAVIVISIHITALLFPALIVTSFESINQDEKFVLGEHAMAFIFTNVTIFALAVSAYLKIIPTKIVSAAKFAFSFEISKRIAIFCVVALIAGYTVFSVNELTESEDKQWMDYANIKFWVENFSFESVDPNNSQSVRFVKNFLLNSSLALFQNVKIVPFLASIALLLLTYLFTMQLTQKRLSGLIATIVLLQSPTFLIYDTTATYDNFWILFYLFSLYIVFKKWYISPIGFLLSLFSKAVTVLFLPATIYQIIRVGLPRRQMLWSLVFYVSIMIILGVFLIAVEPSTFSFERFMIAFTTLSYQLRFDNLLLWFLLPITVVLYMVSRRGSNFADVALVMVVASLLMSPLLGLLSNIDIHPYRYMPLLIFFAVGVGFIFSRDHKTGWNILKS